MKYTLYSLRYQPSTFTNLLSDKVNDDVQSEWCIQSEFGLVVHALWP